MSRKNPNAHRKSYKTKIASGAMNRASDMGLRHAKYIHLGSESASALGSSTMWLRVRIQVRAQVRAQAKVQCRRIGLG